MSHSIFRKNAYGSYYFFRQVIEIHNDTLLIDEDKAGKIIESCGTDAVNEREINFYRTYVHESTHFLDSTTTIWGIEYSIRLYNCLKNNNRKELVDVFLLNDSEIQQHSSFDDVNSTYINYRTIRSIPAYDAKHGAHLLFKYYDVQKGLFSEVLSVPVSMLALIEGHAFAQEQCAALALMKSKNDHVSINLLEREYRKILHDPNFTEYSCILAFTEQLFEKYEFEEKLLIVIYTCRMALDLPTLFPFPEQYIDSFFNECKPELISALKMELMRGMNRSSLAVLMLIALSHVLEKEPIDKTCSFSSELEASLFKIFRRNEETIEKCREKFHIFRTLEYETGCTLLNEKGAELAFLSATNNNQWKWLYSDLDKVAIPQVLLSSGPFIDSKLTLNFDMEKQYFSYDEQVLQLTQLVEKNKGKPHLRPDFVHEWLKELKGSGAGGLFFLPD
ncbi:hypothetical protein ACE41O_09540 [Alteromonas macleodii]|jgi:hypothetical protein|uniref:hypothetical protein n=1 Tax=Alteromonas macleodii TaxID=28108 RepID=UPI00313FF79B